MEKGEVLLFSFKAMRSHDYGRTDSPEVEAEVTSSSSAPH